jgi:hypothetical protein
VTDFYDFDSANARLPELTDTLRSLQSLKADVVKLRDRIVELSAPVVAGLATTADGLPPAEALAESQRLKLRMQGLVDQMIATVARIDDWSIQLREIETGLVDFPALVAGARSGSAGASARRGSSSGTNCRTASPADSGSRTWPDARTAGGHETAESRRDDRG